MYCSGNNLSFSPSLDWAIAVLSVLGGRPLRFVIILLLIVINAIGITVNINGINVTITIYLKKPIFLHTIVYRTDRICTRVDIESSSSSLLCHHHNFSEKSSSLCDCVEYAQEWILSEQLASSYSPQYMRKTFKGNYDDDNIDDDGGGDDYDGDGDDGLQVLTLRDIWGKLSKGGGDPANKCQNKFSYKRGRFWLIRKIWISINSQKPYFQNSSSVITMTRVRNLMFIQRHINASWPMSQSLQWSWHWSR